jgi:hypothetical protein
MLKCKEVVTIVSSEDNSSWRRNLKVQFHLMICKHCKKYSKQIQMVRKGFIDFVQTKWQKNKPEKSKVLEDKIIAKLQQNK